LLSFLRAIDLALRLAYCALVPMILAVLYPRVPIGGLIIGATLATAIALAGTERWRAATARVPVVGGVLGNMARLGDYYAEHPPRPLLYYVLYPLLAPYWLVVARARREFLLYRKLNAVVLVILVGHGAYEYLTKWRPELGLGPFLTAGAVNLIVQLIAIMAMVMPLVTTVIVYHRGGRRKLLAALAVLGALSAVAGVATVAKRHVVPTSTDLRLRLRAHVAPERAAVALTLAIRSARAALPADAAAGDVDGAPLDRARDELEALWKPDEARAFRLWWSGPVDRVLVLYYKERRRVPALVAIDAGGRLHWRETELPAAAQALLSASR
jgi:hypothetical protein